MTESSIPVEQLEGGLRAVFINMPHFRTSSARLTINSGSLHEAQETAGAAHFLEHITFQGTEDMPSDELIHHFSETNGVGKNAITYQGNVVYMANGYDLESVGHMVSQLAFFPTLYPEGLDRERKPIIDEIRGYNSSPSHLPDVAHQRAVRGDRFARPIWGSLEDVIKMTHDHLSAYHARNYRLGNAVLVIASSEPVERQRDYAQLIVDRIRETGVDQPTPIDLPAFNPGGLESSLQLIDLPFTAQTSVSINYNLPETGDPNEQHIYGVIINALSTLAHRRLRSELAMCYAASASASVLANVHFDAEQNWAHWFVSADLDGSDAVAALESMYHEVLLRDLPMTAIDSVLQSYRRNSDHIMESAPSEVADFAQRTLTIVRRKCIDLEEGKSFADNVSIESIRKMHRDITDTQPLITATSPNPEILEKIGEWASSKIRT